MTKQHKKQKRTPLDELRYKIYKGVNPFSGYLDPFVALKDIITTGAAKSTNGKNINNRENIYSANIIADRNVDAIWGKYLNIPLEKRILKNELQESDYRPTKGDEKDKTYYKLELDKNVLNEIVEEGSKVPVGKNKNATFLDYYNLGEHTIGHGHDDKGDYISYYDLWDLNPWEGRYKIDGKKPKLFNNVKDITFGVGTPVSIYDRIYLDNYYNMPKDEKGGIYLPQITITPRGNYYKYGGLLPRRTLATGGSIHIKPSHRGRLTELKARTGKSEAELYNDGNPAHKKMVVFARNARKWKH